MAGKRERCRCHDLINFLKIMNAALKSILDRYQLESPADWENALREIIQELALLPEARLKLDEPAECGRMALAK